MERGEARTTGKGEVEAEKCDILGPEYGIWQEWRRHMEGWKVDLDKDTRPDHHGLMSCTKNFGI